MRLLSTAALAVLLLAGPAAAETFKDWEVSCDAGRACKAVGMAGDADARGYLTVQRRQDPSLPPEMRFWVSDPTGALAGRSYVVHVDGKPAGSFTAPVVFGLAEEEGGLVEAMPAPETTTGLVELLRRSHSLQLKAADGSIAVDISLAGAAAALLYMDDRLGQAAPAQAAAL